MPAGMGRIELLDIPGRWGTIDALGRSRDAVGLEKTMARGAEP
ncbi:hypothetical protein [Micromonospora sp. AMSO31t]|nr:hypothetical protein [Micromonospora sp. AMSO31t]